jgi:acetyl-CoA C-acetyltransferase
MTSYSYSSRNAEIVVAAGIRTPIAKAGGALKGENVGRLGALTARELIMQTGINSALFDEVITGCVGQPFNQANVSRVISLRAGIPKEVPARTVARNCASGMEAVTSAVTSILAGTGELYLCNGVEVMSSYPLLFNKKMTTFFTSFMKAKTVKAKIALLLKVRPSFLKPTIALIQGLTDPTNNLLMGQTAENVARLLNINRKECDEFALMSHRKAQTARDLLRFKYETMNVLGAGERQSLCDDDGIRDELTEEKLNAMAPYFEKPDGITTIGNSCGISDGAVSLIITTNNRAKNLNLTPLARIRSFAWEGCDPAYMGLGPVYASKTALKEANLSLEDIDVIELNEAFAAQVIGCVRAFEKEGIGEIKQEKLNPNGGAIALGHPVGATGARLILTLAHEIQQKNVQFGLATLCVGGGQGGAMVLEKINP